MALKPRIIRRNVCQNKAELMRSKAERMHLRNKAEALSETFVPRELKYKPEVKYRTCWTGTEDGGMSVVVYVSQNQMR